MFDLKAKYCHECQYKFKCANCGEPHPANYKGCGEHEAVDEVRHIDSAQLRQLLYQPATKQTLRVLSPRESTFAAVLQSNTVLLPRRALHPAVVLRRLTSRRSLPICNRLVPKSSSYCLVLINLNSANSHWNRKCITASITQTPWLNCAYSCRMSMVYFPVNLN